MQSVHPAVRPRLRKPTEADLAELQIGWSGAILPDPSESFEMSFREFVFPGDADGQSTVAEIDGAVVGFCSVIQGVLKALYVVEGHRKRGIGAQLLARGIEFSRSLDWKSLVAKTPCHWTGSVPGVNVRHREVISLLEHHGFRRGSRISHMELPLTAVAAPSLQPLPPGWSIAEYCPDDLNDMRVFVSSLGLQKWVWPNWEAMYSVMEERRVRVVARDGDRIVGCVDVLISRVGEAGVNYISVARADRHRGIGSHLLRTARRMAQERGASSMVACNVSVRSFYHSNGWRVQNEYTRMSLRLREACCTPVPAALRESSPASG